MSPRKKETDILPAASEVRQRLLRWYDAHRRDLPWRASYGGEARRRERGGQLRGTGLDPYRVWIAEVMLAQTRVETVVPYFLRFLERFPSIRTLAAADLDEVLKLWEGLGYYARARNLHAAARIVVEQHGGALPAEERSLRALPGVGPYIAAAVSSIAFGQPALAVDGNVRRVLSRLYDLREPDRDTLLVLGRSLVADRPGDVNQALMDLGSSVCKPRSPRCPACPLKSPCLARARGTTDRRPGHRPARKRPHYDIAVGIVWRNGRILIAKRRPEGLLGGLWEFPGGKLKRGEPHEVALVREVGEELDIEIEPGAKIATIDHAYSHFEITLHAFHCHYLTGTPKPLGCQEFAWVRPDQLERYAFPAANRRVLARLAEHGKRSGGA